MKFGYSYKTSDGTRHESIFEARTKEDVFASLRVQGIRPIKVWEIHSRFYLSRRTRIIIFLVALSTVSVFYAIRARREAEVAKSIVRTSSSPRHQIYGDPAIWEEMERDNFSTVFGSEGDRVLAAFAIPGRPVAYEAFPSHGAAVKALETCMDNEVPSLETDSREAAELKSIVRGMKDELRWYVGDGVGTVSTYLNRLRERQEEEVRIYERTRAELENCSDNALREERNAALRAMGLRTIPRPRKGRD